MDRLFVGNIVQRTWIETWSDGAKARGKEKRMAFERRCYFV